MIGVSFTQQSNETKCPHELEGYVYEGDSELFMFCQVDYAKFAFISLDTGNRLFEPVQEAIEGRSEYGTLNAREVLLTMHHNLEGESLYTRGKLAYYMNKKRI